MKRDLKRLQRLARGTVLAVGAAFSGCGSHPGPITAPSVVPSISSPPAVSPPSPATGPITLSGQVVDALTRASISGAIVSINGRSTLTDVEGRYSLTGVVTSGPYDFTVVSSPNYESDYRYVQSSPVTVPLRPIEWVSADSSMTVTIAPDDSLCVNNVQDFPGIGPSYVCRTVRVRASGGGILAVGAAASDGGPSPLLEVEAIGAPVCCLERIQNPTSIEVTKHMVVVVRIEMLMGTTVPRQFVLTTAMNPD